MSLLARKSDLELEAQFISHHRMYLANQVSTLFSQQAQLDPYSAAAKMLEARIQHLQAADKELEMHLNRVQSQRDAVAAQIQTVRKTVRDNIQDSFKLGAT